MPSTDVQEQELDLNAARGKDSVVLVYGSASAICLGCACDSCRYQRSSEIARSMQKDSDSFVRARDEEFQHLGEERYPLLTHKSRFSSAMYEANRAATLHPPVGNRRVNSTSKKRHEDKLPDICHEQ